MREKEKAIVGFGSADISERIVIPNDKIIHDVLLVKSNQVISRGQNDQDPIDQHDSQSKSAD
jgi:hypothetical protein